MSTIEPVPIPGPPQYPQYVYVANPINGFAIASLVCALVWGAGLLSILAVIFGHIALGQIRGSQQRGKALAVWGLVVGYLGLWPIVLFFVINIANAG